MSSVFGAALIPCLTCCTERDFLLVAPATPAAGGAAHTARGVGAGRGSGAARDPLS